MPHLSAPHLINLCFKVFETKLYSCANDLTQNIHCRSIITLIGGPQATNLFINRGNDMFPYVPELGGERVWWNVRT